MTSLSLRAYYAMPVWMQNLMISAYGLRVRRLRYGREHDRMLEDLLTSQWWTPDRLRELQLVRLNALLGHAAGVPFYRRRGLPHQVTRIETLAALPLMSKADVRREGTSLIATSVGGGARHQIHTGGTTGTPLAIHCNRSTLQRNFAFFSRLCRWAGVPAGARVAVFGGRTFIRPDQAAPPYWRSNAAANALMLSSYFLSRETVDAYIDRLRRFNPEMIDAYPSSIEFIARRVVQAGVRDIRPQAVITSSETLAEPVRAMVQEAFGCRVYDYYGGGEMAAFIAQCERGTYHVNPEFGIVEILRDGQPVASGESGEIVATGFVNPVMPLIRYATGDGAVWGDGPCGCGRAFPTVERIDGRVDDVIITPQGRRIGRLDPIFKSVASIQEARIVQDAPDHVRLEVVPDAGFGAAEEATIVQELAARLGPSMRVDVARVGAIPRAASGKLRMVVREAHLATS